MNRIRVRNTKTLTKTMATELKTTMMLALAQMLKKSRIVVTFEDEANNMQLDKEDTQQSNLGSISVCGQLRTYPSPNPTVTPTY